MRGSTGVSMVFGIVLVFLGVVFLLNNLGIAYVDIGDIIETYWPLVLVALGLSAVFRPRGEGYGHSRQGEVHVEDEGGAGCRAVEVVESREPGQEAHQSTGPNVGGWILIGLGLLMLASNMRFGGFDFGRLWGTFWALVVIFVGWSVLRSSPSLGEAGRTQWVFMSGLEQRAAGWPLRSGSYVVAMGAADLDLRVADIPEGETYLDLTVIMGGIDIIVPPELGVVCEGTGILGAVTVLGQSSGGVIATRNFSHQGSAESTKRLRVRCRAIMGAIEFK